MSLVDKRVTAEWLSAALSGLDYNKFIAELKSKNITQDNALNVDTFDFQSLEQSIINTIKGRYENRVLESELEIVLTASEVARLILGDNKWSTRMLFKSMYDQDSLVKEISDNKMIYCVEEVEHNGYTQEVIIYSYKTKDAEKSEPSDEEYETKNIEMYTEKQMKQTFAWNNKDNKPILMNHLLGKASLVNGKPILIRI